MPRLSESESLSGPHAISAMSHQFDAFSCSASGARLCEIVVRKPPSAKAISSRSPRGPRYS